MHRNRSFAPRVLTTAALACVVIGLVSAWRPAPAPATHEATAAAYQAADPPLRRLVTKPIQRFRPGMRVLAENPELAGQEVGESTFAPEDWALVRLQQPKPGGGLIQVELLRPRVWVALHTLGAISRHLDELPGPDAPAPELTEWLVGKSIPLHLPELGAVGMARVTSIEPCPPIEPADDPTQRVVTGTFRHSSASLLDLQVSGEPRPLGVTDNHPFWSADRQAFVPAGELAPGESLLLADGREARLTSITPRAGPPVTVYNLEVDAQHVYYVGAGGVLVHNTCVYRSLDGNGYPTYFGITDNFPRRFREHARLGRTIERIGNLNDLSRFEARAVEQVLIEHFGLENLENVINSISNKNTIYDQSISEGLTILKKIGFL